MLRKQLIKPNNLLSIREKETIGWLVATEVPFPKAIHPNTKALSSACRAFLCGHHGAALASLGGLSCNFDAVDVALTYIDVHLRGAAPRYSPSLVAI